MRGTPERGVRPSVWLIAATMVAGCGLALFLALGDAGSSATPQTASSDGGRARGRTGGRGDRASHRSSHHVSQTGGAYRHHDWSQETELQRRRALGLPGPSFWSDPQARRRDPQMLAMWRSFRNEAQDGEPELPFEPTAHRAELISAEGDLAAATSCDVRVLPVRTSAFNCVVRVTCDGRVLYPNPTLTAGYVPCEVEDGQPVRAVDDGHTSRDGDPLVSFDMRAGTITVEDRDDTGRARYRATLRLDG